VPNGVVASVAGALVSDIVLPDVPGQQPFTIRAVIEGLQGDTNFDGVVDLLDVNNVRNNFGKNGPSVLGDTNGDGRVNLQDLTDVRNNFGGDGVPAPEPGTLGLTALAFAALAVARARCFSIASGRRSRRGIGRRRVDSGA
jgi:hypothetical protein